MMTTEISPTRDFLRSIDNQTMWALGVFPIRRLRRFCAVYQKVRD